MKKILCNLIAVTAMVFYAHGEELERRVEALERELGSLKTEVVAENNLPCLFDNRHIKIHNVAYGNGIYIGTEIGNGKQTYISKNGLDFLPVENKFDATDIPERSWMYSVEFFNGYFVAGLTKYGFAYSKDGVNWKTIKMSETCSSPRVFPRNESLYLSIDDKSDELRAVYVSRNLTDWEKIFNDSCTSIVTLHDTIILSQSKHIYRTNDNGNNWEQLDLKVSENHNLRHLATDGNIVVCAMQLSGSVSKRMKDIESGKYVEPSKYLISKDGGKTFYERELRPSSPLFDCFSVAYNRGLWVMYSPFSSDFIVSTDAEIWTPVSYDEYLGVQKVQFVGDNMYAMATVDDWHSSKETPQNAVKRIPIRAAFPESAKLFTKAEFAEHIKNGGHIDFISYSRWDSKSDFSGKFEDLKNVPDFATEEYVNDKTYFLRAKATSAIAVAIVCLVSQIITIALILLRRRSLKK